jgi:hypothetical protein
MRKLTEEQIAEIRKLWIDGVITTQDIGRRYDVGEGAIRNLAKRRGWPPRGVGRTAAEIAHAKADMHLTPLPADVPEAIERLDSIGPDIIGSHRKDLALLRMIVMDSAREVQWQYQNRQMVEERVVEYFSAKAALDPVGAATYMKQCEMALSSLTTGSRSKTILALIQAYDKLHDAERRSWKLDENTGNKTYEALLKEIHEKVIGNDGTEPASATADAEDAEFSELQAD